MKLVVSPRGHEEYEMIVEGKELTFHCLETFAYNNAHFTGGLVEGRDPDNVYLCIDKDFEALEQIFLRVDEAAAIISILSKAIYESHMKDIKNGIKPE